MSNEHTVGHVLVGSILALGDALLDLEAAKKSSELSKGNPAFEVMKQIAVENLEAEVDRKLEALKGAAVTLAAAHRQAKEKVHDDR